MIRVSQGGRQDADERIFFLEPAAALSISELKRRSIQERGSLGEVAHAFWAEPRRFYIPAWEISLRTARKTGGALLRAQPRYRATPRPEGASLVPARLRAEDAEKIIEFIALDLEVRREDWLTGLELSVEVDAPALWAVPAEQAGKGWRLAAAMVS